MLWDCFNCTRSRNSHTRQVWWHHPAADAPHGMQISHGHAAWWASQIPRWVVSGVLGMLYAWCCTIFTFLFNIHARHCESLADWTTTGTTITMITVRTCTSTIVFQREGPAFCISLITFHMPCSLMPPTRAALTMLMHSGVRSAGCRHPHANIIMCAPSACAVGP